MTVTDARRRFGALLKIVQHEPVLVFRRNGDKAVFVSAEEYKRIRGVTQVEPARPKPIRKVTSSSKSR